MTKKTDRESEGGRGRENPIIFSLESHDDLITWAWKGESPRLHLRRLNVQLPGMAPSHFSHSASNPAPSRFPTGYTP